MPKDGDRPPLWQIADDQPALYEMIMKHGSLVAFLSGDLSSEKFMEEIADEITAFYADLRNTNQGVVKISSGLPFVVTRSAARHLLAAISTQALSPDAAVYVADCS